MTKKTKKHIHNWQLHNLEVSWNEIRGFVPVACFYCHCGKAKKVMVVEEKQ